MNNTLNRKMFMQQGGVVPSQTMLPPAQMMDPPAQMMDPPAQMMDPSMLPPGATQQVAGDLLEKEGAAITEGIMSQVDSAQDYEELMNAIRGNELPIEDRRGELAELVGAPDAEQTPDSVLTLVQPTLSIVDAQGGLDSLMQEQANVAMEDGTGTPTPMAGGLGSMLMAGQPEEPVQMADGGLVRKMASGTLPEFPENPSFNINPYTKIDQKDFKTMYESVLPTFMEAAGTPDKSLQKAQAYASLAGAGLRLAQGSRQPGATFLGDLAGAFQPVPGELTAIASQGSDREAAARMQAAGLSAQMTLEQQKQLGELLQGERRELLSQAGAESLAEFNAAVGFNSQLSAQAQQEKMLIKQAQIDKDLQLLKGSQDQDSIKLQADLTNKRDALLEEMKKAAGVVAFNQRAIEAGKLRAHEINMQATNLAAVQANLETEIFSREGMQLLDLAQRDRSLEVQKYNIDKNYEMDQAKLVQAQEQFNTSTDLNREQFAANLAQAQNQFDRTTAQRDRLAREERDFAEKMSNLTQEQKIELYELGVLSDKQLIELEYGYKTSIANIENSLGGSGKTRAERQSAILRDDDIADSWVLGEDTESARLYDQALGERVGGKWETTPDGRTVYTDKVDPLPNFLLKIVADKYGNSENLPDNLRKIAPALDSYRKGTNKTGDNGGEDGVPVDNTETPLFFDPEYDAMLDNITKENFSLDKREFNPEDIDLDVLSRAIKAFGSGIESVAGLPKDVNQPEIEAYINFLEGLRTSVASNIDVLGSFGELSAGSKTLDVEALKAFERSLGWNEKEGRWDLMKPSDLGNKLMTGWVIPYKKLLGEVNKEIKRNPDSEMAKSVNTFRLVTAKIESSANFLLNKKPGYEEEEQSMLDRFFN